MTYQWSGILLLTPDNKVISMHRDDNPLIRDPGCYGIFGGAVEEGETALEAAAREIVEETNLRPAAEDLELFKTYTQQRDYLPQPATLNVFVLRNVDPTKLQIREGQGVKILDNASNPRIAQDVRIAFEDWFALYPCPS